MVVLVVALLGGAALEPGLVHAQAGGPASGAIQLALRRFLATANTWTATQTYTNVVINGTCTGVGCGASFTVAGQTLGDLPVASAATTWQRLADVAVGSYLLSGGVGAAPVWSTLTLPNAATQGDILFASGSNAIGRLAGVAVGQLLASGGVGANPTYSAIPVLGVAASQAGTLGLANGGGGGNIWTLASGATSAWTLTGTATAPAQGALLTFSNGTGQLASVADVATGQLLASGGTNTVPAYTATPSANTFTLLTGGSVSAPAIVFNSVGANYGLYIDASNHIGVAINGAEQFWIANGHVNSAGPYFMNGTTNLSTTSDGIFDIKNTDTTHGIELSTNTAAITVTSCGTGTVTTGSRNSAGEATATGATACTVQFKNNTWTNTPFCVPEDESTLQAVRISAISTSSFTVTGLTSGDKFMWICLGQVGN